MKPKLLGSLRAPGTVGMGWPDGRRVSPPSLAERDLLGPMGSLQFFFFAHWTQVLVGTGIKRVKTSVGISFIGLGHI
jgi:hypothetical protein